MSKLNKTNEEKIKKWVSEHDGDDFCAYCNCGCESSGVKGGPDGPLYPPCSDWSDEELLENLDTEAILSEMEES